MVKIRIAELNIAIDNRSPYVAERCREYLADFETADITVRVSEDEIRREAAQTTAHFAEGYFEFVCAYRAIAQQLPLFDALVFHAAVIDCDGKAYAFAAPSGTGKSTHIKLWHKAFGERVRVINGDKPIFRLIRGKWYAFGTPWQGKEGWGSNAYAPLSALCFLARAEKNTIKGLTDEEAVTRLFNQVLLPAERHSAECFLTLLDDMITHTPVYLLGCNMDKEAAEVAYIGMNPKGE